MASVELRGVAKTYPGGRRALDAVDLSVADGELVVVVGPSGCGKSTLLRLLAGLEQPTCGSVWIGERIVNDLSPQERNVAMVFQDYALYPHRSVRGNLAFPLETRGLPRGEVERRVDRAARMLGMQAWLDRRPRELSGGQRQRVAMGRALVREPAVFLLDEPLSNLDARLRVQVRDEIAELQRRTATTMVYVTHDQTEAMTLGHRVAVLHEGRIQQFAVPRELYERPANLFVAGFLGSPPMNLVATRLSLAAAGLRMTLAGVELAVAPAGLSRAVLAGHIGEPLTAGLRPEDLRLAGAGEPESIPVTVEQVELLGHETLVHARAPGGASGDGESLVVRLPGMRELFRGDHIRVAPDPARVHLFGADGRALPGGSALPGERV